MRPVLLVLLFVTLFVQGQTLVCPPSSAAGGKPCDVFHYHVQMYDPEAKRHVSLHGINQFASVAACEGARETQEKKNALVAEYVRRVKAQTYEPDRFGPCHCDLTLHTSSSTFLTELQRQGQKRSAEDVRRRVRERLLNLDLPADSELLAGLWWAPSVNAMLAGPRLTDLPQPVSAVVENPPADLRMPRTIQNSTPAFTTIDLPLAHIAIAALPSIHDPIPAAADSVAPQVAQNGALPSQSESTEASWQPDVDSAEEPPLPIPSLAAEEAPADPGIPSPSAPLPDVEDAADVFIRHETQRIQNVVHAIPEPPDETGERVMQACTERLQALSNLRYLILGAGARSRVAQAARTASSETTRFEFVTRLFGESVSAHWIPQVTTDVLLEPDPSIDRQPERILRDTAARYSIEQRRRALYIILTRDLITEEQQLWLIPAVEELLR